MKKRIFSTIIASGMAILLTFGMSKISVNVQATCKSAPSVQNIKVINEYLIPDDIGWCTYYVIIATNDTGKDVSVNADFTAFDKSGKSLSKVNDYAEAVKKGQKFMLYGQFVNSKNPGISSCKYSLEVKETENCTYTSVDVEASKSGKLLEVSATNYSEKDIQGIGVRTVFLKRGQAIAFDTVNIADTGYTFHGGSTNSQAIGMNAGDFDDYIITYTSAGNVIGGNF
jgi:hypothetical protein